jgi:peptidoglycan/LPS O-acetylase OafA/YrhL
MQTSGPQSNAVVPRFDAIDIIRGLSILSVILLHVRIFLSLSGMPVGNTLPRWLWVLLFRNGNGVPAFFAVSGFLITLTSIRRFGSLQGMRFAVFYRIRFARIAPPLVFLLFVLSILHLAHAPQFRISSKVCGLPHALLAALTFHLNWLEALHGWLPPCWTVLWSLSVEEMFYFLFPLLCAALLVRTWGMPAFVLTLCVFVLLGPFARTVFTTNPLWAEESYLSGMDGIAIGCLCAMLTDRCSRIVRLANSPWPILCQIAGAILMIFIEAWEWPKVILGAPVKHALGRSGTDITVLIAGVCLVMFGSVLRPARGRLWTAPIRWLGQHSYEIYLTHEFVVIGVSMLLLKLRRGPMALWVCLVLAGAALLGYLVARFLSEPANRALRGAPLPQQLLPQSDQRT